MARTAVADTERTDRTMRSLNEAAEKIGSVVGLISKIAAQTTTRERIREIVAEYGLTTFLGVQEQIIDYVKRSLKKRIAALPDGVWYGNTLLQHDGVTDRLYELKLVLTKSGERMVFDFTGTAKQALGSVNCAYSGLIGGVTQVLFPLLCFDLPWSQGALLDCIEIISEEGTINNATYPAATSMATVKPRSCRNRLPGSKPPVGRKGLRGLL